MKNALLFIHSTNILEPLLTLKMKNCRLFTVSFFFVRSLRYSASYVNGGYLEFQMYGIIAVGGGGESSQTTLAP